MKAKDLYTVESHLNALFTFKDDEVSNSVDIGLCTVVTGPERTSAAIAATQPTGHRDSPLDSSLFPAFVRKGRAL